jgi:dihydrolipoamide dehydrogenase
MSKNKHTELLVIGAGPGGYAAAFRAADLGKKVILVDKDEKMGGVCLNRGCIPSKALLHITKVMDEANSLSKMGVTYAKPEIDIDAIRSHKDKIVSQLNNGIASMAKARKVEFIQGAVRFETDSSVQIKSSESTQLITFDQCIVAVGSSSTMLPGVPKNNKNILTSKTALDLENIPKSLLIVGGGVIGVELGQVYATLGSDVSLVEFLPNIIPGADQDIVKPLERKLKKQFKSMMLGSKVVEIKEKKNGSLSVKIDSGTKSDIFDYEKILIAIGRTPNSKHLNLEATNVDINERGFIRVDEYQRTSVATIFAIGDVSDNPMLAHKATHQGKVAAEVACGEPAIFDPKAIPSVVYTDPEVAWCGLTEVQAKEENIPYSKSEFPWAASGRAIAVGANQGKTKILFDEESKTVLGVGIVGPSAGDIISEGMLAIEMGSDVEDISLTVHPHPTLGETFALAAEVFDGTITDLYIPKK